MVNMEKTIKLNTKEKKYVKKLEVGFNITKEDKKRAIGCNNTIDVDNNIENIE